MPSLQDVGNFRFLCLMGILSELRYFFLYLEVALRYDPSIMGIMPGAGGCLTRFYTQWCRAVFVDFSYF